MPSFPAEFQTQPLHIFTLNSKYWPLRSFSPLVVMLLSIAEEVTQVTRLESLYH